MPIYSVSRTRAQLSTTADHITVVSSSSKPLRIYIVDWKGMESAAADNEIVMQRSSSGTTPGGAITPSNLDPAGSAASFLVYTSWSAQPTLSGAVLWRFGPNALGGIDKFVALPGAEIPVPISSQVSFRSIRGTSNVTVNLLIEEVT